MEASFATCASSMTSTGTAFVVSVVAAVVAFVVSTTCFSVVALAVACRSTSIFTGETVFCVTFSVTPAVEISSTEMSVVGLALPGSSTFVVVISIKDSVETAPVFLTAVATGTLVVTPIVPSSAVAVISASAAVGVAEPSLVSTAGAAVVSGIAVLVTDSVDTTVLATAVTVETSVATFVSTLSSAGSDVIVSVGAAVADLLSSTTCFSVVVWVVVECLTSLVTFSVALNVCTGETVFTISFCLTAVVKVSLTTVARDDLFVLGTSAFVVTSVRGSVKTTFFSLATIVTGGKVVTPATVTPDSCAVVSASVATDVSDTSVVSTTGTAFIREVVVSVTDFVDTSFSASVVTVKAFVVTSVPTMTSTGIDVVVSVAAALATFVVSPTSLSLVAWAVVGRSTSMFSFSLALVGCTGEAVLSCSFSVTAAVEVSSTMAAVVGLPVLATSTFAVASLIASAETASISLAVVLT